MVDSVVAFDYAAVAEYAEYTSFLTMRFQVRSAAMRVREPFEFSVRHVGRGGDVACGCAAGQLQLALEMQSDGAFCVWLRGARLATSTARERRLRTDERRLVLEHLRAWLDSSGRASWTIER